MKKSFIYLIFFWLACVGASAQTTDKLVEKIRLRYGEIAEKARLCETDDEHGEHGSLVMNELRINSRNHAWRAVGIYQPTYKFFYTGGDDEKRLYPDQLVFVKAERRVSNRVYYEEYLYNETGALIFYFQKADNDEFSPGERRIYFSYDKAIRLIEDKNARSRLTANDLALVREVRQAAATLKELFVRSLKL